MGYSILTVRLWVSRPCSAFVFRSRCAFLFDRSRTAHVCARSSASGSYSIERSTQCQTDVAGHRHGALFEVTFLGVSHLQSREEHAAVSLAASRSMSFRTHLARVKVGRDAALPFQFYQRSDSDYSQH